jgi:DNA polymerase-3 subunit delta'
MSMWQTIGFAKQKKMFEGLIAQGVLSHAYILEGPEQIGKKLFAEDVFMKANKRETFDPADPDLFILAPAIEEGDTKIYIENIRDLKTFLSLTPFYGPYQFVIIDDAHRLTPEASNAFLKLLEEPSGRVVFFLVTSQPQELLPTISSRAQHISFLPHADNIVAEALAETKLTKADQDMIAGIARGRIGWAMEATTKSVKDIKQAITDFGILLKSPLGERMVYAKMMFEKQPYQNQIDYWLAWAYANRATLPNAHRVLTQLLTLHQYIQQPQYNHRALLENALINL